MDRNTAVWDWIKGFPEVDKLFFNFGEANDGTSILIPNPTDLVIKTDITGIKTCRYDFAYAVFLTTDSTTPFSTQNIEALNSAELFGRWIVAQNKAKSYPDFGANVVVTSLTLLSNTPTMTAISESVAKYLTQARIEYEVYE